MGVQKMMAVATAMLISYAVSAQQDLLWYFGEGKAGLKFDANGGAPVVQNDPDFVMYESISVVSDCEGNLLFYTDGTKIFDASHNQMTNGGGLLGPQENNSNPQSGSSPNGVLVVGDPADSTKYYVFTVGETISGGANLWRYHVVDMKEPGNGTATNPLGEVISKNDIIYNSPMAESMSAVSNTCGDSLWIVTHGYNNDTLYALPLTQSGGIGTIVKSKLGPVLGGGNGSRGSSDFSPNGDKFAMGFLWPGGGHVFDFDFGTGVFSNHVAIPGSGNGVYGIEFSFDGASVYLGKWSLNTIHHYNIATNTVTTVANTTSIAGDLERAPDGKIYVGTDAGTFLGVINTPDVADGSLANFVQNGIDLGVKVEVGLPQMLVKPGKNLIDAHITVPYGLTDVCDKGGQLQLTASPACGNWSGGAYVDNNGLFDPSGLGTPGTYEVYYSIDACITPDTVRFTVEDCCPPIQVNDAQICEGTPAFSVMTLVDTGIGTWSLTSVPTGTGSAAVLTDTIFDASNYVPGTTYVTDGDYQLTYTYWNAPLAQCPDSAVAIIEVDSFPRDIFLGTNAALNQICGTSYTIQAKSGLDYTWTAPLSGNVDNQSVSTDGWYYLSVTSPGESCPTNDSIEVEFDQAPVIAEHPDTFFCDAGSVTIGVDVAGLDYAWKPNNETTQTIVANAAGEYSVVVLSGPNGFCPSYDTIQVATDNTPVITAMNDTFYCDANSVVIGVVESGFNYLWSAGSQSTQSISVNSAGDYSVIVTTNAALCPAYDTVNVRSDVTPSITPMNDTLVCGAGSVDVGIAESGYSYLWSPGNETTQTITANSAGEYTVEVLSGPNGDCPIYDTIDITLAPPLNITFLGLGDDTTACPATDTVYVVIDDNANYDQYNWNGVGVTVTDTSVYVHDFSEGDIVGLTVYDVYGCSGGDTVSFSVFCDIKDPNIPNIFSPNNDGPNDTFTPIDFPPSEEGTYNALYPKSNLKVYDRWGLLMYEDNDYPKWDGKNKLDRECSPGVYFWTLDTEDINGKQSKTNGYVHLYR